MRNDSGSRRLATPALQLAGYTHPGQDDPARSEGDPLELPPFERATRFRQYAEEMTCRAAEASSDKRKAAYLKFAAEWLQIAERLYRLGRN